jgi:inosine triphosphate pyrophosphatase
MKDKLIIVTGNKMKFEELSLVLGDYFDCQMEKLPGYFEIQGTPEEILIHKLKAAYEYFKVPVLVDDTSVHFEALGGFPGPYIKDFIAHMKVYDMGVKFAGTRMSVSCRLGIYDGKEPIIAVGTIEGGVVMPKDVDPGPREFDLFMQVDGTDKPMIEYSYEEKNNFSHRGLAVKNLIEMISNK